MHQRSRPTSGKAGTKLSVGDVERAGEPWATGLLRTWAGGEVNNEIEQISGEDTDKQKKQFSEKSFFEYKLYTLSQPSTVRDRQIKQLNLLKAAGVKARRRYLYDPNQDVARVIVQLLIENTEENQLGRPLPKGRVTFTAVDADGEMQFLGLDEIDHTPTDEELKLNLCKRYEGTCA